MTQLQSSNVHPVASALLCAATVLAPSGCEERGDFEVAPGMKKPAGPTIGDAAYQVVRDVKITVAMDAWTGARDVYDEVTPVEVTLENDSDVPIEVRYESMGLMSDAGDHYSAIPPFELEGEVDKRIATPIPDFVPTWQRKRYYIVDTYRPIYDDDVHVWGGKVYRDPTYYDHYYAYWDDVEMPTPEMLAAALPEGVVETGGSVSGFVYFEEIDPDDGRLTFRMRLKDAKIGAVRGTFQLPFDIRDLGVQPE